jgi:hypothetical protein
MRIPEKEDGVVFRISSMFPVSRTAELRYGISPWQCVAHTQKPAGQEGCREGPGLHSDNAPKIAFHLAKCKGRHIIFSATYQVGGMAEWLKAAVLKTVRGATPSWVRILLPPPDIQ